ncbi:MAG: hypothetical protein EXR72_08495 [Myxococcales bacterium]|nr:hypothetical protein [Myxococcales bacterium]
MSDQPVVFPRNAPGGGFMALPAGPQQPGAFWAASSGEDLMVEKGAPLPEVCVKCGRTDGIERRNQNFSWFPPWIYALLLVNLLVMAVVSTVLRKQGRLWLPLCHDCARRWRKANLVQGLTIAWLIVGLITCIVFFASELPILGLLTMVSALVSPFLSGFLLHRKATLRPRTIDDRVITLQGVHPDAKAAILTASQQPRLPSPVAPPPGTIAQ